ncbi:MAG: glycosyltransferase family 4 protein [Luteibaculum sp.]
MKIAVNTRLLIAHKLDGIGYFAHEILKRWVRENPDVKFYFLFDRKPDPQFIYGPNVKAVILGPQARHPFLYFLWFHISVRRWLRKNKPKAFFSPEGYLSPGSRIAQFNVIHDLNFEHNPQDLPLLERWYYRKFFPQYALLSKHIFTVSKFSKQDIVKQYSIPSDKISVVYNGIRSWFKTVENSNSFKQKYTEGKDFILHVGTLHPRKNIVGLISAYNYLRKKDQSAPKLVLAGRKKWWTQEMENAWQNSPFKTDIIFTDRLSTEDLVLAYNEALFLAMLSSFEGFGLPMVEAMACGCPVLCAENSALKEIASEAAYILPKTTAKITGEAFLDLVHNPEKREQYRQLGLQHAKNFSWDKAAEKIWSEMMEVLKHA